jgi:hypothetical protein
MQKQDMAVSLWLFRDDPTPLLLQERVESQELSCTSVPLHLRVQSMLLRLLERKGKARRIGGVHHPLKSTHGPTHSIACVEAKDKNKLLH